MKARKKNNEKGKKWRRREKSRDLFKGDKGKIEWMTIPTERNFVLSFNEKLKEVWTKNKCQRKFKKIYKYDLARKFKEREAEKDEIERKENNGEKKNKEK